MKQLPVHKVIDKLNEDKMQPILQELNSLNLFMFSALQRQKALYTYTYSGNALSQQNDAAMDDPMSALDDPMSALDDPMSALDDPMSALDDPMSAQDDPMSEQDDSMSNQSEDAKSEDIEDGTLEVLQKI